MLWNNNSKLILIQPNPAQPMSISGINTMVWWFARPRRICPQTASQSVHPILHASNVWPAHRHIDHDTSRHASAQSASSIACSAGDAANKRQTLSRVGGVLGLHLRQSETLSGERFCHNINCLTEDSHGQFLRGSGALYNRTLTWLNWSIKVSGC